MPKTTKDGGSMLDEYAAAHGLTRGQLGTLVQTSGATISRLISRHRGPGVSLALRMHRRLGIPIEAWTRPHHQKERAA